MGAEKQAADVGVAPKLTDPGLSAPAEPSAAAERETVRSRSRVSTLNFLPG